MNKKAISTALVGIFVFLTACIYDPPRKEDNDITIINRSPDSLYYYVHDYQIDSYPTYNFAYDFAVATDTNKNKYDIAYNINKQKILPGDTLHPFTFDSWKAKTQNAGGLTVLFYKRNIQHLKENEPLSDSDIFRRIDLTNKQLDSLKYTIQLN